jgi:hypothetical protein
MTHDVRVPAPLQYPHVRDVYDRQPYQAVARESKTHQVEDLPKPASDQRVDQQLLVMHRRKLILVGMDLRCHLIDMFV